MINLSGGTLYPGVKYPRGQDKPGWDTLPQGKVSRGQDTSGEQDKLLHR